MPNLTIEALIAKYRRELHAAGCSFFTVYAYKDEIEDKNECKITSNASQQGVRAILHAILQPTEEAVAMITKTLYEISASSCGQTRDFVDAEARSGTFHTVAVKLFEALRPHWTIKGWEKDKKPPEA